MAADRVDLVDEDDAGGVLLALLEHVAHPAGADADEHLDEIRAGDGEERHVRLAGDGPRQQRLAGARGRSEEHTSELQSLMRTSYAVFCLKKKKKKRKTQ